MRNRGFTLIEIIVVVGLLALVALLVGANFVGLSQKQKETEYERLVTKITTAAGTYMGLNRNNKKTTCMGAAGNGTATLTLTELVTEGLISEDDLFDPRTENKDPIKLTSEIKVTCTGGKMSYTFTKK